VGGEGREVTVEKGRKGDKEREGKKGGWWEGKGGGEQLLGEGERKGRRWDKQWKIGRKKRGGEEREGPVDGRGGVGEWKNRARRG